MNLPTTLTILRIFLVPFLVVVLLAPPSKWADSPFFGVASPAPRELLGVIIFLVASISDWLDGYLARRRNQVTTLGTLLDPIADKLLTSGAFISLVEMGLAPAWMVVIIVGREFVVSGLRSILAVQGFAMPASAWGKLKTLSQVVAIILLILTRSLDRWGRYGYLGVLALWISMLLALISASQYVVSFLRVASRLTDAPARGRTDVDSP
ncbi:MAG: CDP-diacylglycerol--glycerol-3-phosphate 3-phosphatidyltransferase [Acidobacteriota bacterium]|nr:MAG: CDP-diacylglycerol--glycerol-3-phosphate 3-phosphatidyltransferase [Acidobacteriota bacterium]